MNEVFGYPHADGSFFSIVKADTATLWQWSPVTDVSLPEFVEGQAKGELKIFNGTIYRRSLYWSQND